MVNNFTNKKKTNNYLSPKIIEYKKKDDTWCWNLSLGLRQEQKWSRVNRQYPYIVGKYNIYYLYKQ
jgi:hypothetical protein